MDCYIHSPAHTDSNSDLYVFAKADQHVDSHFHPIANAHKTTLIDINPYRRTDIFTDLNADSDRDADPFSNSFTDGGGSCSGSGNR